MREPDAHRVPGADAARIASDRQAAFDRQTAALAARLRDGGVEPARDLWPELSAALDAAGLEIAVMTRNAAHELGLPELLPAEELHGAMLQAAEELGRTGGWPAGEGRTMPAGKAKELAVWMGPVVGSQVVSLLSSGMRIPEEVLGPREMRKAWGG